MSILEISMNKGEILRGDGGAFVFKKGDIDIKTQMREGFFKNIKVSLLGGESFFVNDFVAKEDNCTLGMSGPPIGDIFQIPITGDEGYIIQSGTYIASTSKVELDTQWQGFTKGLFGSELFMLKATGDGLVFVNAYGSIIKKTLEAGESMTLDNYHLVALSLNCDYKVTKFGGIKSTILGGEGLVTEIKGPGTVYFQTKNLKEFIDLFGTPEQQQTSANTLSQVALLGLRFGTGMRY